MVGNLLVPSFMQDAATSKSKKLEASNPDLSSRWRFSQLSSIVLGSLFLPMTTTCFSIFMPLTRMMSANNSASLTCNAPRHAAEVMVPSTQRLELTNGRNPHLQAIFSSVARIRTVDFERINMYISTRGHWINPVLAGTQRLACHQFLRHHMISMICNMPQPMHV